MKRNGKEIYTVLTNEENNELAKMMLYVYDICHVSFKYFLWGEAKYCCKSYMPLRCEIKMSHCAQKLSNFPHFFLFETQTLLRIIIVFFPCYILCNSSYNKIAKLLCSLDIVPSLLPRAKVKRKYGIRNLGLLEVSDTMLA